MGLRQRLEDLADSPPFENRESKHEQLSRHLNDLHSELLGYFQKLHGVETGRESFHDLTGQWFELIAAGAGTIKPTTGLTLDMAREHRTYNEEILRCSLRAQWGDNPFREKLDAELNRFLATPPSVIDERIATLEAASSAVDAVADASLIPLDANVPFSQQVTYRSKLADLLERVWLQGDRALATGCFRPKSGGSPRWNSGHFVRRLAG